MTLHIFNPEHDIALASGLSNFTAPHAGRQLRHDLGFLPALWAGEGDVVLVDDQEWAQRKWQRVVSRIRRQLQLELPQAASISLRASAGKNLGQIFSCEAEIIMLWGLTNNPIHSHHEHFSAKIT